MRKYLLVLFLFFITVIDAASQDKSDLDQLKQAYLDVQNENYEEACPYFKRMLKQYPKEPIYNYYVGRCELFLEKNPEKSLSYLRFASTKEVPEDVYFYLGIAYLKSYHFDKALKSFQWFERSAGKRLAKQYNISAYISMAQNGIYLTRFIKKPIVYQKDLFELHEFYKSYSFENLEGEFRENKNFFDDSKDSAHLISVMFIPNQLSNQEILYFSAINAKRGDYDIYSITRLSDTTWSKPENLGEVINTPFDDNFPFMHSDGSTLYFASKGHYSMGGYDLYKSNWSWNTQQWSEPENLDFPVNSPYDDILFVPSPNKKTAYFASNRNAESESVMVYKIKYSNSEPYIELDNYSDLLEFARLDVNATEGKNNGQNTVFENKQVQQDIVKIKSGKNFIHQSEYDSLLNLAIKYQLKSDSLKWVIDEKRLAFDNIKSGQERAQLSNAIIELEREIYTLQKKADQCYARVREIEQANLASEKMIYDYESLNQEEHQEESVQKIYVEPAIDSLSKSKLTVPVDESFENENQEYTFGLKVEEPSIYNKKNPIPMNEDLPDGVIYMIQLGAFSSEKSPAVFNGLTPLSAIKAKGSDVRKYYAGKFRILTEAEEKLSLARSRGFKDAYIIAFKNGSVIPISKAIELEKNQIAHKTPVEKREIKEEHWEELEIIFVLKGEVEKVDSSLVKDLKKTIKEENDLFIHKKQDKVHFTIKSFKSYESALLVKKNIEAILKKEVEVHAYFAENQIPLDQARKITK